MYGVLSAGEAGGGSVGEWPRRGRLGSGGDLSGAPFGGRGLQHAGRRPRQCSARTDARAFPGALGGRELPDAGGGRMRPSCRSSWHSGGRCVGACHRTGLSGRVGSRLSSFTPAVGGCGQAAGAAGTRAGAVWAPVIARTFPGALGVDMAPLRRRWADAAGCMSSWHSGGRLTGACPRRGTSRAAPRGRRACRLGCGGPALQFMVGMVASAGASLRAAGP